MNMTPQRVATEHVYERILQRVDRAELSEQCRSVATREAKLIQRRIRGVRRVLQHAYDVNAAQRRLAAVTDTPVARATATPAMATLVEEIEKLQRRIARRMRVLGRRVGDAAVVAVEEGNAENDGEIAKHEPEIAAELELERVQEEAVVVEESQRVVEVGTPVKLKSKKRRLSRESVDSPRKPPRPGRLAVPVEEEWEERGGPDVMSSGDEHDDEEIEDEDQELMELELLDTEFHLAASLEKARRLRKISGERRMGELPGLIRSVLAEINRRKWEKLPRELLGTLSATMGASTTIKPEQRQEIQSELNKLRAIAMKIDDATARKYPTLNGSKARFLSSMEDLPYDKHETEDADAPVVEWIEEPVPAQPVYCENIEALCTATEELATRANENEEPRSMEEIEELLTVVGHVFDNPTTARSDTYCVKVAQALEALIAYVQAIPRNTRRRQQCEQTLHEYHTQLTTGLPRGVRRVNV